VNKKHRTITKLRSKLNSTAAWGSLLKGLCASNVSDQGEGRGGSHPWATVHDSHELKVVSKRLVCARCAGWSTRKRSGKLWNPCTAVIRRGTVTAFRRIMRGQNPLQKVFRPNRRTRGAAKVTAVGAIVGIGVPTSSSQVVKVAEVAQGSSNKEESERCATAPEVESRCAAGDQGPERGIDKNAPASGRVEKRICLDSKLTPSRKRDKVDAGGSAHSRCPGQSGGDQRKRKSDCGGTQTRSVIVRRRTSRARPSTRAGEFGARTSRRPADNAQVHAATSSDEPESARAGPGSARGEFQPSGAHEAQRLPSAEEEQVVVRTAAVVTSFATLLKRVRAKESSAQSEVEPSAKRQRHDERETQAAVQSRP
jgi:hypothetical protein